MKPRKLKTERILIMVSPDEKADFDAMCAEKGVTLSEEIRRLMRNAVERRQW